MAWSGFTRAAKRLLQLFALGTLSHEPAVSQTPGAEASKPSVPLQRHETHWQNKHQYLASLVLRASRKPPLDCYFLGDSLTEFWTTLGEKVWAKEFGKMSVLNCGVSGDTTQNILWRITHGEFEKIQPKVVILMAGINNLGMDAKLSSDDLADGIKRIISTLQSKAPNSKLLLLSLLPTGEPESDLRKRILATNKVLSTLGDEKTLFYLDLHDSYLDSNNRFPDALTPDGLHLNAKGYQIWADKMRPALSRILEMK